MKIPKLIQSMNDQALLVLFSSAVASWSAAAQITFRSTDVRRQVGVDQWKAYVHTSDQDVRDLLGAKGGPHRWDFSDAPAADDDVHLVEVVARDDGGHGGRFPDAAYAERVTRASDGCQTWSFYKVIAGAGRFYFGIHDGCKSPQADIVFDLPTIDLPEAIKYGDAWEREVEWEDTIDAGFIVLRVAIHFTNETEVDAYGSVVLPEIGEVPALRLNEVNTYVTTDLDFGIPIDTQVFRNYVWLVPGIGKAVHIVSEPKLTPPPEDFRVAKTVWRVFESNRYPRSTCEAVENLRVSLKGEDCFLAWDRFDWANSYRIEACNEMTDHAQWEPLRELEDNFSFEPVAEGAVARFFRVMGCR